MINVYNINHTFDYEVEKLIGIFFPFEKIKVFHELTDETEGIFCFLKNEGGRYSAEVNVNISNKKSAYTDNVTDTVFDIKKECELKLCTLLYKALGDITGYSSGWGILTGIRPAKLFLKLSEQFSFEEAERIFKDKFSVSDKKISLIKETVKSEERIISLSKDNSYSLYISIPFCPSRCSYCSFVSHSIEKASDIMPEYVSLLCKELKKTAEIAKMFNLRLETVYIGGGTPTTLEPQLLEKLLSTVEDNFDLSYLREFTVEAGRPDTITEEKLRVLKNHSVSRISINPQTMNDKVLEIIGRKHSSHKTVEAFKLARSLGFDNINMDLIAGLEGDSLKSFEETLNKVIELDPESVTVHSLSYKRASFITKDKAYLEGSNGNETAEMVDLARAKLEENKIMPYYMYRQSKTVGNLENVGYAKKGFECLYNVFIMDETHSIFAAGASAVTKLREPHGNLIERIFNFKYPYEYITRFDEQILRKEKAIGFYDKFSKPDK